MTGREVVAYVDGSSTGRVGPGGWGVLLVYGPHRKELSGYAEETTNQRMELTAACEALEAIREGGEVSVVSDSAYVVSCMQRRWYARWYANDWQTSTGRPVANRDLWERLVAAERRHYSVRWVKVEGHVHEDAGSPWASGNNRSDKLAREAKKQLIRENNK